MPDYGKAIRLRRIVPPQRPALIVAFDHALILGPIPGTKDPAAQIRRFIDAEADAVLLNLGTLRYFAGTACTSRVPGLIARLDWTTAFGDRDKPATQFRSCLIASPEDALRNGADAVIVFLVIGTGDEEFERAEVQRVAKVARECERIGMPLIVESLARGPEVQNPCDPVWVARHSRMAAELGADLIKTEYTGDPASMRAVIDACPIPILVLGGSRAASDQDVLHSARSIVESGAAGLFFGRNIFQAENISRLMQQLRAVLADRPTQRGS